MLTADAFRKVLVSAFHLQQGDAVLAAVSGGMDSVVLVHLLHSCRVPFVIAHVNFKLRGEESDEDEQFCAALAEQFNVPLYLHVCSSSEFDEGKDIQEKARNIRYDFFKKTCREQGLKYIATAHHLNDDIETALFNFFRGSGSKGLTGIPARNENIIRPLLTFSREEIQEYAETHHLKWREDSSNLKDDYSRNKIRHHIIPLLRKDFPQGLKGIQASMKRIDLEQELLQDARQQYLKEVSVQKGTDLYFSIEQLKKLGSLKALLLLWLEPYGFTPGQIDTIAGLTDAPAGKAVLSPTHRIIKDRTHLILTPLHSIQSEQTELIPGKIINGILLEMRDNNHPDDVKLNTEQLVFPLYMRTWQKGDRMNPTGIKGSRKVSDILTDMKLPLHIKEQWPVVCDQSEIIWIPGYRIAEKCRIHPSTSHICTIRKIAE
ncbi:MAG: tRNA lysidine(34) synthetase TilS [Bacteroidia bacterium]